MSNLSRAKQAYAFHQDLATDELLINDNGTIKRID